jgi:hypothetical protein
VFALPGLPLELGAATQIFGRDPKPHLGDPTLEAPFDSDAVPIRPDLGIPQGPVADAGHVELRRKTHTGLHSSGQRPFPHHFSWQLLF